jgi:hypothetical protein
MGSNFRQGKRSLKDSTTQTIAKDSIDVSKKMPNGLEQWFNLHEGCFYQTSEVTKS